VIAAVILVALYRLVIEVVDTLVLIQAKIVILIALLALVRKLIVVDLYAVSPASLAALAELLLSLGVTYWMMRERDDRVRKRVVG
jgi:uncharacterized membrane protein (DUF373 family)